MANVCARCGKGAQRGHKVSHSGVRTKRVFKPNLHTLWVEENGRRVKKQFCTKCLRRVKKEMASSQRTQTPGSPA